MTPAKQDKESKPMTNYNERLDVIKYVLLKAYYRGKDGEGYSDAQIKQDKQALTSLTKELVAEAQPPVIDTSSRTKLYADDEGQMWYDKGQNDAIARFEQNLLKALEEV